MQASAPENIYFVTGPSMQPDYGDDNENFDPKEDARKTFKHKEDWRQNTEKRQPRSHTPTTRQAKGKTLEIRPSNVVRDKHDFWDVHRGRRSSNSLPQHATIPVAPDSEEERIAE